MVIEAKRELQEAVKKNDTLEEGLVGKELELAKALQAANDTREEARGALKDIQEARRIAAGAFADLPCSISDAAQFYRAEEKKSAEKHFWSQYLALNYPVPFVDQLKQLIELHQAAKLAMKDLVVRLWPAEPIPSSYFGLVKRIVGACPRLEVIKRSVCIEGARMAFARAKVHWGKLDAEKLMTEGRPEGKEHRKPELYYNGVLKGARLVAEQCTKDTIFP
ncbi:hypothetical protein CFC21_040758 [Triticum aestivum]|uniref:Uncharacterized protein n=2 Tax=Triticum aestivum TaxID=4565 RepID=A0A9R1JTB4_WHEAT|nr:hypothetical protein CFC21_040757 [Triticum aestivum]KAF7028901.1 hypothetical protein CFC21_040758 [Triticum aestivum]